MSRIKGLNKTNRKPTDLDQLVSDGVTSLREAGRSEVIDKMVAKVREEKEANGTKEYLKEIKPWHDEILKRIVLLGHSPERVSKDLGISPQWVVKIWRSEAGLKRIEELAASSNTEYIKKKVALLRSKAVEVLDEILNSTDPDLLDLKSKIARDVLDRTGIKEEDKHTVTFESVFKTIRDTIESTSQEIEHEANGK